MIRQCASRKISTLIALTLIFSTTVAWASKRDLLLESTIGENIGGGFFTYFNIQPCDIFTNESREVIWFGHFKLLSANQAKLYAHWITPAGEVFKKSSFTTQVSNCDFGWNKLDIQGVDKKALDLEGEWSVKVFWDEEQIDEKKFYIGERKFTKTEILSVTEDHSDTASGHILLAKAYFAKNDMERVIRELRLAQEIEPNKPEPYLILGNVYNAQGYPDKALLQFTKAQSLGADAATLHRGLANSYAKMELFEEAIREYGTLKKLSISSKEDEEAIEKIRKAVSEKEKALVDAETTSSITDEDVFLRVTADKKQMPVDQQLTLKYTLYLHEGATYQGFDRQLIVKNHIINLLQPMSENPEDGYRKESAFTGIEWTWDKKKSRYKVTSIRDGSPSAGLLYPGDYLEAIDREVISDPLYLTTRLKNLGLTYDTVLSIERGNKKMDVTIVPSRGFSDSSVLDRNEIVSLGVDVQFKTNRGVCVVRSDSASKLYVGDIIKQVNERLIHSMNDWRWVVNGLSEGQPYQILLERNGANQTLSVTAKKTRVGIRAQYAPVTADIKREMLTVDGRRYMAANVETVTMSFGSPGVYSIDPGSLKIQMKKSGVDSVKTVSSDLIEVAIN